MLLLLSAFLLHSAELSRPADLSVSGYLSLREASGTNEVPCSITATVIYYDPDWRMLFVQGDRQGMFAFPPDTPVSMAPGDMVRLTGKTHPTENFRAVTATVLPEVSTLRPVVASSAEIAADAFQSKWVEVQARVRSAQILDSKLVLDLEGDGVKLEARVRQFPATNWVGLIESDIRVKGALGSRKTQGGEPYYDVWVQDWKDVTVEKVNDPFDRPLVKISELANLEISGRRLPRVKVRGKVVSFTPDELLVIADDTGRLETTTRPGGEPVFPGDEIELIGQPFQSTNGNSLRLSIYRWVPDQSQTSTVPNQPIVETNWVFRNIQAIRSLPLAEAGRNLQADIRCVVTYFDPEWDMMFVADGPTSIYVAVTDNQPLKPGDRVRIRGAIVPGDFAPMVEAKEVTFLGEGSLPSPKPVSLETLLTGKEDSQWVEVKGVVQVISTNWTHTVLTLATPSGRFNIEIPNVERPPLELIDCYIAAQGAAGSVPNKRRQLRGVTIHVPSLPFLKVIEKGPENPFHLDYTPAAEIGRFNVGEGQQHRVHVRGVVTYFEPGKLIYIQDDTGAVECNTRQQGGIKIGDIAEVVGFPEPARFTPTLQYSLARVLKQGTVPKAREVTARDLLDPASAEQMADGQLVKLTGLVLEQTRTREGELLLLQFEGAITQAILRKVFSPGPGKLLPPKGSLISIQGICALEVNQWQQPQSFSLLLRSPADAVILQQPAWWTPERTLRVLGVLALIILAVVFWGTSLQRKVADQTALLKRQFDREVKLAELGAQLNGIHDAKKAAEVVMKTGFELLGGDAGSLDIFEPGSGRRQPLLYFDTINGKLQEIDMRNSTQELSPTKQKVLREGAQLILRDKEKNSCPELLAFGNQERPSASLMFVPLRRGTEVLGILSIQSYSYQAYTREDIELLQTLAEHSAAALNRIRAEEAARKDQERFSFISQASNDAVYDWDITNNILTWNQQFPKILGCPPENVEPTLAYWVDRLHPDDVAKVNESLDEAVRNHDDFWSAEYRLRRDDGAYLYIFDRGYILRDKEGKAFRMVGTMQDISARKQVQIELERARDAAERASRTKSDFLATMSHEIRTPMNGIIGMTNLLLDTPLSNDQKEFAETVKSSSEALLGIINDILDFSKVEAGKLSLQSTNFNLFQVIKSTSNLLVMRARAKNIELRVDLPETLPAHLNGDPGRLRQVLLNLVGNAVKFTERGEVVVSGHLQEDGPEQVTIRIEVRDTGIGIPPEAQEHLFQPFSQADSSTSRKFGGTGLGLVISKKLVELMGGEIGFTSQVDQGSTFWVVLTFRKAAVPPNASALPRDGSRSVTPGPDESQATVKILIAEDNPVNQKLAVKQLQKLGYSVDIASNGAEVLAAIKQFKYPLILMDCQMPELDGYETTRRIRALEQAKNNGRISIIAITADAMIGDREKCLAAGMDDYLAKPVRIEDLDRLLKKHLQLTPD